MSAFSSNTDPTEHVETSVEETEALRKELLAVDVRVDRHQALLKANEAAYLTALEELLDHGVAIPSAALVRIAAAALAHRQNNTVPTTGGAHQGPQTADGANAGSTSPTQAKPCSCRIAHDRLLPNLSIAEMVSLVKLLDNGRKARQAARKLEALEARGCRPKTKKALQRTMQQLSEEVVVNGSLTGSLAKRLADRIYGIPADKLEFYLLQFPKETWRDLADVLHLQPGKFQLPYFLRVVYGEPAPEGSLVADVQTVVAECLQTEKSAQAASAASGGKHASEKAGKSGNKKTTPQTAIKQADMLVALLRKHPVLCDMYSFLRSKLGSARVMREPRVRCALAAKMPLGEVLWFYEELEAAGVDTVITSRLERGETLFLTEADIQPDAQPSAAADGAASAAATPARSQNESASRMTYGKLMDRLLYFRKSRKSFTERLTHIAEIQLAGLVEEYSTAVGTSGSGADAGQARVAVFGDASASMQIAINTATIVGSVLSACFNGHLSFFNHKVFAPPVQPKTVNQVLQVAETVRSGGRTNPAATLLPWFQNRTICDLFIVVTDEGENGVVQVEGQSCDFASLFKKYRQRVNPHAACFFVSFWQDVRYCSISRDPEMQSRMKQELPDVECRQFRFDPHRPDLSKLSKLLAMVSLEVGYAQSRASWRAPPAEGSAPAVPRKKAVA